MKNELQRETELRTDFFSRVSPNTSWELQKMWELANRVESVGDRRTRIAIYTNAHVMELKSGYIALVALSKAIKGDLKNLGVEWKATWTDSLPRQSWV